MKELKLIKPVELITRTKKHDLYLPKRHIPKHWNLRDHYHLF